MENVLEFLSKDRLLPVLKERVVRLDSSIKKLESYLRKGIFDHLRISPHKGSYQYYLVTANTGKRGTFVPKKDWYRVEQIAQQDYDQSLLKKLKIQRDALQTCLEAYHPEEAENCWSQLHPARKRLTVPRIISDDDYAEEWQLVDFRGRPFDNEDVILKTARGERVRSKSELIIANALNHFDVPYRYEYPYKINVQRQRAGDKSKKKTICINPDFTCLNKRLRKAVIWEHFGLVDDSLYAQNMVLKLDEYQQNGFYLGDNLIMTTETSNHPLNYEVVERSIKKYLF